jgi:DNA sulfur modification protein DndE
MSWRVFGGEISDILLIALKQRCYNDNLGTDKETLATQFRLHLHRGIGYLAGDPNIKKIEDLIAIALHSHELIPLTSGTRCKNRRGGGKHQNILLGVPIEQRAVYTCVETTRKIAPAGSGVQFP